MAITTPASLDVSYEDDPRVLAEAAVDDYANHVVPLSARMSRGSLTMAWYGVASAIFYVVTGAAVAANYGTKSALVGLILTIVVYSAINWMISSEAADSGLSVAMFPRGFHHCVGRDGAGAHRLRPGNRGQRSSSGRGGSQRSTRAE